MASGFGSSEIWLRLSNATFKEALRYTVSLQQLQVTIGDSELIVGPITSRSSDLPATEFAMDSRILAGEFGNIKDLVEEAGIKLRPFESIIRIPQKGIAFAKVRSDSMTDIALWILLIDRVIDPEQALGYGKECLLLAGYYLRIQQLDLSQRRVAQAQQTFLWLQRLCPEFRSSEVRELLESIVLPVG